jgi:hypothetical protein
MEHEPDVSNIDKFIEYHWRRGWDEAIAYAVDVATEMLARPDQDGQYDKYTIEELKQRIV